VLALRDVPGRTVTRPVGEHPEAVPVKNRGDLLLNDGNMNYNTMNKITQYKYILYLKAHWQKKFKKTIQHAI